MKRSGIAVVAALALASAAGHVALGANAAGLDDATRMGSEMMNPSGSIGITEKSKAGDFKMLFYGNSITSHAPSPGIGWTNNCGMAASSKEKDYAHIVVAELEKRLGKKADFRIRNLAPFERNYTTNVAAVAEIAADAAWSPDYVVIALGENAPNVTDSTAADYTKFLVDLARPFAGKGKKVVLRSPFWMNPKKAECTAKAAAEVGAAYVDAGPLGRVAENKALGLFSHQGVANHPGDIGMRRIADLILSGFFPQPAPASCIGRVKEVVAKVDGRDDCKRMDYFDIAQPVAVTGDTAVALKLKCEVGGDCVMYWRSESTADFASDRGVRFSAIGDGEFHTYVLRPDWKVSDRIVKLRVDFPYDRKNPDRKVSNSLKAVVFLRHGFAPFDSKDADGIVFRMKSDEFEYLSMNWKAMKDGQAPKPFTMGFTTIPDGREHTFWFDFKNTKERMTFGAPHWFGTIEGFCFRANLRSAEFMPKGVEFVKGIPSIPADPVVRQVFPEDAIPRTGRPLPIEIVVRNYGTVPAEGIRFAVEGLPDGVRVLDQADLSPKGSVAPSAGYDYIRDDYMPNGLPNERRFRITLSDPGRPVDFTAKLVLSANGGARSEKAFRVKVLPSLGLAKCAYPPEPKPLDTGDVEIGVFLFPGWMRHQWYPAWDAKPERKPVLGWYDDRLPEVRDWQIKWLVENGVSYAFVDWYWDPGKGPRPGYWFEGIAKARYRKYLKYAALWCNEGAYRHSEKDQEEVTKYWIDNFFSDPQYLKIDGKPVVGLWGLNMERSLGPGGAKKLLAISQKIARDAGYPGIYFVSMHGEVNLAVVRRSLKDAGFSASFEYSYGTRWSAHWPGLVNGAIDYSAVADSSLAHWQELRNGCDLPFFPSLSTGWGNLPWLGDRGWEIANKTPEKFAKVCRDAKRFSEETGVKRLLLGPLDEWCEGEIGWPNAEHGFGMLEAVRETFAKKPPEGFPLNYAPQDVGLGPYTKAEADTIADTCVLDTKTKVLYWLKSHQCKDGSWRDDDNPAASTALAVLAYLSCGEGPGYSSSRKFAASSVDHPVALASEYLVGFVGKLAAAQGKMSLQDETALPIVARALAETYGMTKNPNLKEAAIESMKLVVERNQKLPDEAKSVGLMDAVMWSALALESGKWMKIPVEGLVECHAGLTNYLARCDCDENSYYVGQRKFWAAMRHVSYEKNKKEIDAWRSWIKTKIHDCNVAFVDEPSGGNTWKRGYFDFPASSPNSTGLGTTADSALAVMELMIDGGGMRRLPSVEEGGARPVNDSSELAVTVDI